MKLQQNMLKLQNSSLSNQGENFSNQEDSIASYSQFGANTNVYQNQNDYKSNINSNSNMVEKILVLILELEAEKRETRKLKRNLKIRNTQPIENKSPLKKNDTTFILDNKLMGLSDPEKQVQLDLKLTDDSLNDIFEKANQYHKLIIKGKTNNDEKEQKYEDVYLMYSPQTQTQNNVIQQKNEEIILQKNKEIEELTKNLKDFDKTKLDVDEKIKEIQLLNQKLENLQNLLNDNNLKPQNNKFQFDNSLKLLKTTFDKAINTDLLNYTENIFSKTEQIVKNNYLFDNSTQTDLFLTDKNETNNDILKQLREFYSDKQKISNPQLEDHNQKPIKKKEVSSIYQQKQLYFNKQIIQNKIRYINSYPIYYNQHQIHMSTELTQQNNQQSQQQSNQLVDTNQIKIHSEFNQIQQPNLFIEIENQLDKIRQLFKNNAPEFSQKDLSNLIYFDNIKIFTTQITPKPISKICEKCHLPKKQFSKDQTTRTINTTENISITTTEKTVITTKIVQPVVLPPPMIQKSDNRQSIWQNSYNKNRSDSPTAINSSQKSYQSQENEQQFNKQIEKVLPNNFDNIIQQKNKQSNLQYSIQSQKRINPQRDSTSSNSDIRSMIPDKIDVSKISTNILNISSSPDKARLSNPLNFLQNEGNRKFNINQNPKTKSSRTIKYSRYNLQTNQYEDIEVKEEELQNILANKQIINQNNDIQNSNITNERISLPPETHTIHKIQENTKTIKDEANYCKCPETEFQQKYSQLEIELIQLEEFLVVDPFLVKNRNEIIPRMIQLIKELNQLKVLRNTEKMQVEQILQNIEIQIKNISLINPTIEQVYLKQLKDLEYNFESIFKKQGIYEAHIKELKQENQNLMMKHFQVDQSIELQSLTAENKLLKEQLKQINTKQLPLEQKIQTEQINSINQNDTSNDDYELHIKSKTQEKQKDLDDKIQSQKEINYQTEIKIRDAEIGYLKSKLKEFNKRLRNYILNSSSKRSIENDSFRDVQLDQDFNKRIENKLNETELKLKQHIQELLDEIKRQESTIENLILDNYKQKNEIIALKQIQQNQNFNTFGNQQNQETNQELLKTKEDLKQMTETLNDYRQRLDNLQNQIQNMMKKFQELIKINEDLKKVQQDLISEKNDMQTLIIQKDQMIENLRNDISKLKIQINLI